VVKGDELRSDVYVRKHPMPMATPPSPPPLPPMLPLADGQHHRILTVPGFVSRTEAKTLREFAAACFGRRGKMKIRAPVGDTERVSVGSAECEAGGAAVLLARVEERIAILTGMPAHEGEETILFTDIKPVGRHGPWFGNVHHDKNKQERREATVLVYLSSQTDEEGGHTLFPSLPRDGASALQSGTWADAMRTAYDRGDRAIGCRDKSVGCNDEGGVVPHAEAECERALTGSQHSVAVRPTLGTALVFWSVLPDGSPDRTIWHTGCLPRASGNGRWAMQKFKSATTADFSSCTAPRAEQHPTSGG